ncbi:MAG: ferritin family protein [Bacillota bacterium]|nr:ferritin family protein [Bacillota bacterium]
MAYEGFRQAIALEEEGRKFYTAAAAKATHPLAAKVFASLAIEEIEHRLRLEVALEGLVNRWWWEPGTRGDSSLGKVFRDFFSDLDPACLKETPLGADDARALEVAMESEEQGLARYEALIAHSRDDGERAFFTVLRDEERAHLVTLENVARYLTSPADWPRQDDKGFWAGPPKNCPVCKERETRELAGGHREGFDTGLRNLPGSQGHRL